MCVFSRTLHHTAVHSSCGYSSDGTQHCEERRDINHSRYILFNERLGTEVKYLLRPDPQPERGRALSSGAIKSITHYPSPPSPPPFQNSRQTPNHRRQQDKSQHADIDSPSDLTCLMHRFTSDHLVLSEAGRHKPADIFNNKTKKVFYFEFCCKGCGSSVYNSWTVCQC